MDAKVPSPHNGDVIYVATAIGWSTNNEGNQISEYDPNLKPNTAKVHNVKFPGGAIQQYSVNLVSESLYKSLEKMDIDISIWMKF